MIVFEVRYLIGNCEHAIGTFCCWYDAWIFEQNFAKRIAKDLKKTQIVAMYLPQPGNDQTEVQAVWISKPTEWKENER